MNDTIFFLFYNLARKSIFVDKVVIFFAEAFPYIVILSALIFLLFYHKKWEDTFLVFFSAGLAALLSVLLKLLIHTPRPFLALPNVQNLFPESGYAFPSGHSTFFMALAVSLFFLNKKVGYIFIFFAFLIGLARITAGVHFPVDILGGFILGALVAFFLKNVYPHT